MSARLLATQCCLLSIALCAVRAEPVIPPSRELVVYLTTVPHQPLQPVQEMQREVTALLQTAGYRVDWRNRTDANQSVDQASVVVLQLKGVCQSPERPENIEPLTKNVSLASTAVVDGKVLPFSWLECETLTKLLAPSLVKEAGGKRDHLYGRAMGRLVAHELFHVLSNTIEHDHEGVAKPSFSAQDVLAENFAFEDTSIAMFADAEDDGDPAVSR